MADWIDALERLTALHRSGALTDSEFTGQKRRILQAGDPVDAAASPISVAASNSGSQGSSIGWVLGGLILAVLLGVMLWWQMVDDKGLVRPVPTPGTASAGASPAAAVTAARASLAEPAAPATPSGAAALAVATAPLPDGKNAAATFKPSFRCTGQADAVLVMICSDRALARQDRILSERFKAVLQTLGPADQQAVMRQQRGYLRERAACEDEQCLTAWYDRVNALYQQ